MKIKNLFFLFCSCSSLINQIKRIYEKIHENLENLIDPYGRASHVFQKI